jgi:hypothetical protein
MFSPQIKVGSVKYGQQGIDFQVPETRANKHIWKDLGQIAEHSIARKTWNTYGTAERMLAKFCKENGRPLELPADEELILSFIHWLIFERGLAAASISGYLAGVKKLHTIKGLSAPQLRTDLVRMVIEGKKNLEAAEGKNNDRKRLAVSPLIMKLLKARIREGGEMMEDKLMLWSACTLLYHGAFRGAELLARNTSCFDPAYTLLREDICLVTESTGKAVVQIKVKAPKESKTGAATIIDVFQTDTELCPVRAVKKWMTATRNSELDLPAFRFVSGVPLASAKLNSLLKEWLSDVVPGISTHSFRIGAASLMGKLGFSDKDVKAVGRWGSRAFEGYMRLPRTKRRLVAEKLAKYH